MKILRIQFTTGKYHEMRLHAEDAEVLASSLNTDPNGTTRINAPDGILIVNRNHVTHVQVIPE
jgi:hypothetical protein